MNNIFHSYFLVDSATSVNVLMTGHVHARSMGDGPRDTGL